MGLLTEENRRHLVNYSYKGGDASLTYKYVLSPLAQFCVDHFVSMSVAPNLITFVGLLIMVSSFVFSIVVNPSLEADAQPRWLCVYTGLAVLLYQTLDNMDGKQARRTKSSSALGMLFDHGCDAINSVISPVTTAACLGMGWELGWVYLTSTVFVAFFFQTWEEYYVGEMNLPVFNGPSEGLLMTAVLCFFSGLSPQGPHFWTTAIDLSSFYSAAPTVLKAIGLSEEVLASKITPGLILISYSNIWAWITVIIQFFKVLRVAKSHGHSTVKAVFDTIPFFVFSFSVVLWLKSSPIALSSNHFCLITVLLVGSIFIDLVTHLMLMHICQSPVKSCHRYFAYLIAVLPGLVYIEADNTPFGNMLKSQMSEVKYLYAITAISALFTCSNLYSICKESADALGIYIFVLDKKHKQ